MHGPNLILHEGVVSDRDYFDANPDRTHRYRHPYPVELEEFKLSFGNDPSGILPNTVLTKKMSIEGHRRRFMEYMLDPPPADSLSEAQAKWLWDYWQNWYQTWKYRKPMIPRKKGDRDYGKRHY